jgi:hypothetical protein
LLKAIAAGDENVLANLRRIAAHDCLLEIIIGIDQERDKSEIEWLGLPHLTAEYLESILTPKYNSAGFEVIESGVLSPTDWSRLETSWARKLQGNESRTVVYFIAQNA